MNNDSLNKIVKDIKSFIELEKEAGLNEVVLKATLKRPVKVSSLEETCLSQNTPETLEELKEAVISCTECALSRSRRNPVFGEGSPSAKLMFIGEAPGLQEDIQARPFVGKAGTLLTKIIEAIGLKREDVYIANCLKCRPPQNRNPFPLEIVACREFFMKQIKIINPKVICCLGKFASQTVLMSEDSISRLRGKFYNFENIKVMPTFHPAYLLRNPQDKRLVWEDMKKIRDYLGGLS